MYTELVKLSLATHGVAGGQHKDFALPEAEAKKRLNKGDQIKRTWGECTAPTSHSSRSMRCQLLPLLRKEANAFKDAGSV